YGTTFTYTGSNSGSSLGSDLVWVRTSLYNFSTPLTASPALVAPAPPVAYTIPPIEYCSDINLTTCQEVIPPAAPPSGFFPAYVRFCKTQADPAARGAVTGTGGPRLDGAGRPPARPPRVGALPGQVHQPDRPAVPVPALRPLQPRVHRQ